MRVALLVACLAVARVGSATCLDDCQQLYGGSGPDYASCVQDCGVCGNGDLEGDEECDDGNLVNGDCCDATCHFEPAGNVCDDGDDDPCTNGTCDGEGDCDSEESPATTCHEPVAAGRSTLTMRAAAADAKDLLEWKWRGAQGSGGSAFGNPTGATGYDLCVYDATGLLASISVPAADGCDSPPCWKETSGSFHYRSRTRDPDGAAQVTLRQSRHAERARIFFRAEGMNLDLPDLSALESPLTVQLHRSDDAVCWSAQYSFPPRSAQEVAHFKGHSDPEPQPTSTTTSTTTTTSVAGSSTTLPGALATVQVTVLDNSSLPVEGADVTITYGDADQTSVEDFTDATGVIVFTGQPVGVPATVSVDDDQGRQGESTSSGFQAGTNDVTVVVR